MIHEVKTRPNGERCEYWKNDKGLYHRIDGPAIIHYHENGNIEKEIWCIEGEYHRRNGPAIIRYYDNGQIYDEQYYINREWHRENGPAYVRYGRIKEEIWCNNGKQHRGNGPAIVNCYHKNGKIINKEYWWNGHKIDDIVEKLFGCVPDKLTKDQSVLLKLSIPEECFIK